MLRARQGLAPDPVTRARRWALHPRMHLPVGAVHPLGLFLHPGDLEMANRVTCVRAAATGAGSAYGRGRRRVACARVATTPVIGVRSPARESGRQVQLEELF